MKVTKENYFSLEASRHYMGSTQYKGFLECEAKQMAVLNGDFQESPRECFTEGHYVHSWNEGKLEEFKANHPEIYSSRGATAGQLKANYKHCTLMIETLDNDPMVKNVLSGEKEVILTAEMFGIPWKIMIDDYNPNKGVFSDLKALRSMDGKFWNKELQLYENFLDAYGYKTQMAIYAEIERKAMNRAEVDWLIPHMVIVTKQDPPDHEIIYFDHDMIREELNYISSHIERVKAVKSGKVKPVRCGQCEYCRSTKKISEVKHYSYFNLY